MYRKPDGSIGVSFTRFMGNAFPPFMFDSTADPGHISLEQRDMFYMHQLVLPDPYGLNENSIAASGIIDHPSVSRSVFKALQKTGVLDVHGHVDTLRIGPKFTHDLAIISAVRQKQVVDLLFWWEEEGHRLTKLQGEQRELETMVKQAGEEAETAGDDDGQIKVHRDQLAELLERVKMKIRQHPSQRQAEYEEDRDAIMMRYRNGTAHQASAGASASRTNEAPPSYTA